MKSAASSSLTACCKQKRFHAECGVTLVELMVSITLGLFVVMAATALLVSAKSSYVAQDEDNRIRDAGRYGIETISRAVRQAAYENWDTLTAPVVTSPTMTANVAGLDAARLIGTDEGISLPLSSKVNGSDLLALRFFGSGNGGTADGAIVNCAGFGVAAVKDVASADADRGWSIFYVAEATGGEPELYCKYRGEKGWASDAIARGVESLQVLYGVDTDGNGLPNQLMTASALNALDEALVLDGADATAQAADKNRKTHWKKVVLIKAALLVRGEQNVSGIVAEKEYDLFGSDYSAAHAATDKGVHINVAGLSKAVRNRNRKIFSVTIQLRNAAAGSGL